MYFQKAEGTSDQGSKSRPVCGRSNSYHQLPLKGKSKKNVISVSAMIFQPISTSLLLWASPLKQYQKACMSPEPKSPHWLQWHRNIIKLLTQNGNVNFPLWFCSPKPPASLSWREHKECYRPDLKRRQAEAKQPGNEGFNTSFKQSRRVALLDVCPEPHCWREDYQV